jgi:hypothetical protein
MASTDGGACGGIGFFERAEVGEPSFGDVEPIRNAARVEGAQCQFDSSETGIDLEALREL